MLIRPFLVTSRAFRRLCLRSLASGLCILFLAGSFSCCPHDPAVAVGVGSRGAGVGMHSGGAPYGGVHFGSSFSGSPHGGVVLGLPLRHTSKEAPLPPAQPDTPQDWQSQY